MRILLPSSSARLQCGLMSAVGEYMTQKEAQEKDYDDDAHQPCL
ncbi:MAG: hypothetical protein ABSB82_25360 [Terriglobia bacterium]